MPLLAVSGGRWRRPGAMPRVDGPLALYLAHTHHLYHHHGTEESGSLLNWLVTEFEGGQDIYSCSFCSQRVSTSLPTAPTGDSHLLVWPGDSTFILRAL